MLSLPYKTFILNVFIQLALGLNLPCAFADTGAVQTSSLHSGRTPTASEPLDQSATVPHEITTPHAFTRANTEENFPYKFEEEVKNVDEESHFFYQFIKMLGTLGLLVAFMLFASWFLKRLMSSRIQQMNTSSHIQVIEHRPLSNKSAIYLVEALGKTFVVGESMQGISLLLNYDKPFDELESESES